jgi:Ca-activated chloride channel family protein
MTVKPLVCLRQLALQAGLFLVLFFVLLLAGTPVRAGDSEALPAEGPYFQVDGGDPAVDRLPLKSTHADVRIAGVIADVTVIQQYRNEGRRPIEARYVFPGSTRAAVYGMTVHLAGRVITATIREKQKARQEYEQARREGRTSALLEQSRPNVFEMNVANILPGDDVRVELRYTELVVLDEGRYRFVFPTVAGPRYHRADGGSRYPNAPFLLAGEPSRTAFDLELSIESPLPVSELVSTSHEIAITGSGSTRASVRLEGEGTRNDRDFILDYRLAGDHTATGLMLYRGEDEGGENFFLAMVEPPRRIAPAQVSPRDYVFVLDVSGSMWGYPLNTAKVLMRRLIGQLRPWDTFNVMLFSGGSSVLSESSVAATSENLSRAIAMIESSRGGGGTEIVPALRRIASLPKREDVARTVIVVTDGYVSIENEVFALVRKNLGASNVFAFGIGSSVNRHLIEGIARAGQGEAFVVTRPDQADAQAERLRKIIESPVLTSLHARFEGMDVYDVEPAQLPDVLGGRPVLIWGKWRDIGDADSEARLILEGRAVDGPYREVVRAPLPSADARALRHLWSRARIQQLSDEEALMGDETQRGPITALGLRYGLLTQYTSFIAVDQVIRTSEPGETVDQPSPMPQGVSDLSIGSGVPSTPEPGAWLSLLVVLGVVLLRRRLELAA